MSTLLFPCVFGTCIIPFYVSSPAKRNDFETVTMDWNISIGCVFVCWRTHVSSTRCIILYLLTMSNMFFWYVNLMDTFVYLWLNHRYVMLHHTSESTCWYQSIAWIRGWADILVCSPRVISRDQALFFFHRCSVHCGLYWSLVSPARPAGLKMCCGNQHLWYSILTLFGVFGKCSLSLNSFLRRAYIVRAPYILMLFGCRKSAYTASVSK